MASARLRRCSAPDASFGSASPGQRTYCERFFIDLPLSPWPSHIDRFVRLLQQRADSTLLDDGPKDRRSTVRIAERQDVLHRRISHRVGAVAVPWPIGKKATSSFRKKSILIPILIVGAVIHRSSTTLVIHGMSACRSSDKSSSMPTLTSTGSHHR